MRCSTTSQGTLRGLIALFGLGAAQQAMAGNWGQTWGSFLWGSVKAQVQAVPTSSFWMLAVTSLFIAAMGALKMREK